jgi:hypothetical protein
VPWCNGEEVSENEYRSLIDGLLDDFELILYTPIVSDWGVHAITDNDLREFLESYVPPIVE